MKFANIRELKMNTADLLDAVDEGEEIILTYRGKPRALICQLGEEDIEIKGSRRRQGILGKGHPFLKLMGKARDEAADVSSNKYRYLAQIRKAKR